MLKSQPGSEVDVLCLADKLRVSLSLDEKSQTGKSLVNTVMKKWLPAGQAMLQMVICHLPSPVEAQRYRVEVLYEGPMDDQAATGM